MTADKANSNRADSKQPIISRGWEDFLTPGAIIELAPDEAEALGAFKETALDEAWRGPKPVGKARTR